jgi:hypothetical protein
MLGPPPTGLKRRATVRMLPRPHHLRPPAQRVRSPAKLRHAGSPVSTKAVVRLSAHCRRLAELGSISKADAAAA